jgi:hypothetical protein
MEVAWSVVDGTAIEKTIAVLLNRENPRARRVRPSRGDGGLDIIVPRPETGDYVDYQVKGFGRPPLTASQKRQVEESLKAAIKTHNDPNSSIRIAEWLLTLPQNLTHVRTSPGWSGSPEPMGRHSRATGGE